MTTRQVKIRSEPTLAGMLGETVHEAVGATHRGFVQAKGYISFNGQSEFRDPPNISDTQEIRMPPRKADVKIFTTMSVFNLIGADSPGVMCLSV